MKADEGGGLAEPRPLIPLPEVAMEGGTCHFVATPIGNLGDVGLRALAVLAAADVVYAEDTRHTRRLLDRYGLRVPLASYHDHNKVRVVPQIVSRLKEGAKVAVEVSIMAADAGALSGRDIIAIGGSSKGADAALVIKPAHQSSFFHISDHCHPPTSLTTSAPFPSDIISPFSLYG